MSPSTPAAVCACHCGSSGRGRSETRLRTAGAAAGVEFLGWQTDEQIRELYRSSPGDAAPRHRRLRHRPGRVAGVRHAGGRAQRGRRPRNGHRRRDRRARGRHQRRGLCRRPGARAAHDLRPGAVRRNAERFSRASFCLVHRGGRAGHRRQGPRWKRGCRALGARHRRSSPTSGRRPQRTRPPDCPWRRLEPIRGTAMSPLREALHRSPEPPPSTDAEVPASRERENQ